MNAHDRSVGGIRCTQVLELLSDFVDDELNASQVQQINAHLAGCDWCERFGGEYVEAVRMLRIRLASPAPVPEGVRERLMRRLQRGEG
jgi:anti-sigma factor RsiW